VFKPIDDMFNRTNAGSAIQAVQTVPNFVSFLLFQRLNDDWRFSFE